MSLFIFAGSMQFAAVPLLTNPISLIQTFILTLSINARHLFYGVSMLVPFKKAGNKKPYMIFALTDESYSLLINHKDDTDLMFWIQLMNQSYWVIGTLIGYAFGTFLPFSTEGIEFSMTALFLVIFMDKFKDRRDAPLFLGLVVSIICLVVVGKQHFIIPSMIGILIGLVAMEGKA